MPRIKIYQINQDRDEKGVIFESYVMYAKTMGFDASAKLPRVDSTIYDEVYSGTTKATELEEVYRIFNGYGDYDRPDEFHGRSLSVSDVIEVISMNGIKSGFYYCDNVGWKEVDFDHTLCNEVVEKKIKVVYVEPGKLASAIEIDTSLESLQKAVGGYIEAFYPFKEPSCIVCNEEGKITGLDLNRAIYDKDGTIIDIIAGSFFICDCSGDNFGSLDDERIQKYLDMYKYPETFIRVNGEIKAIKCEDEF